MQSVDPSRLSLLFVGKTDLQSIHLLSKIAEEGLLNFPKYIPYQFKDLFKDLSALSTWSDYSLFLNQLNTEKLDRDFKDIL
ncbi:tyrosine/phenylalanine carboxypeptidase domain-containing protein [Coxiella-like endosymbiont]|uniref:tyrosine/phenylalanine carboxypeptidase domain-containing protein n=1 Tax=Coxiella-like endosymbiont TaxID=1592897 RepID=UPI0034E26054